MLEPLVSSEAAAGDEVDLERHRRWVDLQLGLTQRSETSCSGADVETNSATLGHAISISSTLGWRLREEWDLLRRQAGRVVIVAAFLLYGTSVLMNLAFYRFPVGHDRLVDLGHEVIPSLDERIAESGILDAPMYTLMAITVCLLLGSLCNNTLAGKRNPKPHIVNMVLRMASVHAIGHFLRGLTYLSTSPPGSAARCLAGGHPEQYRPTLVECFTSFGSWFHNCGDLLFSGHMLLSIILALTIHQYAEECLWVSRSFRRILCLFSFSLCILESYLILAARHHYSADVVVAWYVTPLLWHWFSTTFPRDMKPDLDSIAKRVLEGRETDQTV